MQEPVDWIFVRSLLLVLISSLILYFRALLRKSTTNPQNMTAGFRHALEDLRITIYLDEDTDDPYAY